MSVVSDNQIEELRTLFLKDVSTKGNDSLHPKDLQRVKTDNEWLRRFITHQECNIQNAVNMLWTSVTWRKDYKTNDITESNVKMEVLCSGAFFAHGKDIDGCHLFIFKCSKSAKGAGDPEEIKRCVVYWFERLERLTKGNPITIFFDMENCGLGNMDMDFVKYLIGLFKEYYPYFLNYIIIYEMPWILSAAFKIVKSWLPEKAIEKIKFVSKKDVKTLVPADQALKCWGGDNEYVFSFVPEEVIEPLPQIAPSTPNAPSNNNKKQVHFVDASMSEVSGNSVDKESDGVSLKVTPPNIISFFRDGFDLVSTLELQNVETSNHISYKLKTTSPEKFRVKPSTGCLAPGETTTVTVTLLQGYQLGGLSRDKFLVMSIILEPNELTGQEYLDLWKNPAGRKVNQHRLKCVQSGDGLSNGSVAPSASAPSHEVDRSDLTKLSAAINQLVSHQEDLRSAVRRTQHYQLLTVLLVLVVGAVLGYLLRSGLESVPSETFCRNTDHP